MNSETLHGGSTVAAQWASFNKVMLANMFVLEVSAHGNLTLESSITYGAMIRQALCVCREMFSQVVFPEKSLLANSAFVRLDACVAHFMPTHVSAIWELHIAYVAFKQLSVGPGVGVLCGRHIVVIGWALRHVCG